MADLLQSIQDMLKEETWTRATISNYTQNDLMELAAKVEQAKQEGVEKGLKEICEECLRRSRGCKNQKERSAQREDIRRFAESQYEDGHNQNRG